jgi:DNA (cytosine-5)-methyltransferase 1
LERFAAIHASPPCQAFSVANNIHGHAQVDYIDLTRKMLRASGLPYVIENVPGAPLRHPVQLCGLSFGLGVRRHRLFESNVTFPGSVCPVGHPGEWVMVFGHTVQGRGTTVGRARGGGPHIHRQHVGLERGRQAMGIDWMTLDELSQAIPPAYTRHIGGYLLAAVSGAPPPDGRRAVVAPRPARQPLGATARPARASARPRRSRSGQLVPRWDLR